jgi:hypothetical protein
MAFKYSDKKMETRDLIDGQKIIYQQHSLANLRLIINQKPQPPLLREFVV